MDMDDVEDSKMDIVLVKPAIQDPGWDFSATGITLPAWGKVIIVYKFTRKYPFLIINYTIIS